jgi:hypothetical protein
MAQSGSCAWSRRHESTYPIGRSKSLELERLIAKGATAKYSVI